MSADLCEEDVRILDDKTVSDSCAMFLSRVAVDAVVVVCRRR